VVVVVVDARAVVSVVVAVIRESKFLPRNDF